MKIILITDNDTGEIIKAYTEKKFIEVANKEYYKANDFNGNPNYFTVDSIDFVIDWYIDTSEDNLSLDVIDLEYADEEVQETQTLECTNEEVQETLTIRAKIELITFTTDDFIKDVEVNCNGYIYDVEVLEEIIEEEYTTLICKFEVDRNHDFYDIIMDCTSVSDADILEVYNN